VGPGSIHRERLKDCAIAADQTVQQGIEGQRSSFTVPFFMLSISATNGRIGNHRLSTKRTSIVVAHGTKHQRNGPSEHNPGATHRVTLVVGRQNSNEFILHLIGLYPRRSAPQLGRVQDNGIEKSRKRRPGSEAAFLIVRDQFGKRRPTIRLEFTLVLHRLCEEYAAMQSVKSKNVLPDLLNPPIII
jgi:hypothetical protein